MPQIIKVQEGQLTFESTDLDLSLDVEGKVTVDSGQSTGIITSSNNSNIVIATANGAYLAFSTLSQDSGILEINKAQWPNKLENLDHGALLFSNFDTSGQNKLEYSKLIIGSVDDDELSSNQINQLYPNSFPGNWVLSPTSAYLKVDTYRWVSVFNRTATGSNNAINIIGQVNNDDLPSSDLNLQFPAAEPGDTVVSASVVYTKSQDQQWIKLGYPTYDSLNPGMVPYDVAFYSTKQLQSGAILGSVAVVRELAIYPQYSKNKSYTTVVPDSAIEFSLLVSANNLETSIGTITFTPGNKVGTVSIPTQQTLDSGSILKIKLTTGSVPAGSTTITLNLFIPNNSQPPTDGSQLLIDGSSLLIDGNALIFS